MREGRFSIDDMEGDIAAMGSRSVHDKGIFISGEACLKDCRNRELFIGSAVSKRTVASLVHYSG